MTLSAGLGARAAAQQTIATDRPGFAFSAASVAVGAFQLEAGIPAVSSTATADGSKRLISVPAVVRGALVALLGGSSAEGMAAYAEVAAFPTPDADDPAYVGAGVTWLVLPLFQLDASVDRGITDAATDWIFGLGASVRLGR